MPRQREGSGRPSVAAVAAPGGNGGAARRTAGRGYCRGLTATIWGWGSPDRCCWECSVKRFRAEAQRRGEEKSYGFRGFSRIERPFHGGREGDVLCRGRPAPRRSGGWGVWPSGGVASGNRRRRRAARRGPAGTGDVSAPGHATRDRAASRAGKTAVLLPPRKVLPPARIQFLKGGRRKEGVQGGEPGGGKRHCRCRPPRSPWSCA